MCNVARKTSWLFSVPPPPQMYEKQLEIVSI